MWVAKLVQLKGFKLIVTAALLAALTACAQVYTTQSGTVGVNRAQYMSSLVSASQLNQEAQAQYQQIITSARKQGALDNNASQTKRVQTIANKLIAQVGVFRADASSWPWEVHVLKSGEINAWCMPAGKIAVYTGLLDKVKPTDAELAAVIGHEIAHALREHARERVSQQMVTNIGLTVLAAVTNSPQVTDLGANLSNVMFNLPNSRSNEAEADNMGVELAARAGYDPRAAISLWQKMAQVSAGGPPEILSTHPSSQSRINNLQIAIDRVLPLYK